MKYSLTNKAIAMLLSVLMLFSIASTFAENFYNGSNIEPDEQLILSSPEPSNYPPVPYPTIPVPPPEHCEYYPNCECDYNTGDDCEIPDCDCEGACDCEGDCECKDEGGSNEAPVVQPCQGEKGDTDDGCPYCECEADCPYCECGADCRGSPSLDADLAMTNHRNLMEAATTNDPPVYFDVYFEVFSGRGSLTANEQNSVLVDFNIRVREGYPVHFVASPNEDLGYIVQGWNIVFGDDTLTGDNTATHRSILSLSGHVEVTVSFHRPERSLTFNTTHISGANRGDVNGSPFTSGGPVMSGSTIFFTACEEFLDGRYAQWHTVPQSPTTRYGPTLSFTMPPHDVTDVYIIPLDAQEVTFSVGPGSGAYTGNVTARYTWSGGPVGGADLDSGYTVPQTAHVTFVAPTPNFPHLFAYEWSVNDNPQGATGSTFTYHVTTYDINVTVTLVEGFTVTPTPVGAISYTSCTPPNAAGFYRAGSVITFTAARPLPFDVYEFVWTVNEETIRQHHLSDGADRLPPITLNGNVRVNLELVRGHTVTFGVTASSAGSVSATRPRKPHEPNTLPDNVPVEYGHLQAYGTPITFIADPAEPDVFFIWTPTGDLGGTPHGIENKIVLDNTTVLNNTLDVRVSFDPGYLVTFGVDDNPSAAQDGNITARIGAVTQTSPFLVEPGTVVVFEASIPARVGDNIYRVGEWVVTVNGETVPQGELDLSPSSQLQRNTVLSLPITGVTTVHVSFVRIEIEFYPPGITVERRGLDAASPFIYEVEIRGTAEGEIEDYDLVPPTGVAWPDGLSVSVYEDKIIINSYYPLSYRDNTWRDGVSIREPFRLSVTREGVTKVLDIHIYLPFMSLSKDSVTIRNEHLSTDNTFSVEIGVETNASGDVTFQFDPNERPPGLSIVFDDAGSPVIRISGARPDFGEDPIVFEGTVYVLRGGIDASFKLDVNITPPPRIDTITPTQTTVDAFELVSVHGTPPGAAGIPPGSQPVPPGPVNAVFNVVGVNLDGQNAAEVETSISASLPDWIYKGDVVFNATSPTSATVTVPLTVTSNNPGVFHSGDVKISTSLHPPNQVDITPLTVNQAGPITLDPNVARIRNYTLPADPDLYVYEVRVTGSGVIELNRGSLRNEITFYFTNRADENIIRIFAVRPRPEDGLLSGSFPVTVTRDGIDAVLTIDVHLTPLDIPEITVPPEVDAATFGDLLDSLELRGGEARFGGAIVEGTFSWTYPNDTVGNAGGGALLPRPAPIHSITFKPDDPVNFDKATGEIPVIVNRADPTVTWPTATATYASGQTLSNVALTGGQATFNGDIVLGTFSWTYPGTPVGNAGSLDSYITFTPTGLGAGNFNPVSAMISFTVEKASQNPPPAPSAADVTAVSITLQAIPPGPAGAVEFYMNTTGDVQLSGSDGWQTEPTFGNLRPYTRYYFFARFPGGVNHHPSPPSQQGIYTEKAELRGRPTISGDGEPGFHYRDILTVNYRGILYAYADGSLGFDALDRITFQWYRNGSLIPGATGETYILDYKDIGLGNSITVRVEAYNTERHVESAEVGPPILKRVPVAGDLVYSLTSVVFNGEEHYVDVGHNPSIIKDVAWLGSITVEYYWPTGSSNPGWSANRPINAGDYPVQVIIAGGTRYTGATIQLGRLFTIEKARPERQHLNVTLPGAALNADVGSVSYNSQPHSAVVTATSAPNAAGLGTTIAIYYYPVDGYDKPTRTAPTFPGEYQVTVSITEGVNFIATENPIPVGSFTIQGTDIPGITYLDETSFVFDGTNRGIVVTAEGSYVYFRDTDGVYRLTESPGIRNVGELTVYFVVTRPNTGYNRYYSDAKVTITPRQLTWDRGSSSTPATVLNKIYDRTPGAVVQNAPTLSIGGANGVVAGDDVSVAVGTAVFAQSNADENIAVTGTNWGIAGGGDSGNYIAPTDQPYFANANIDRRQLIWDIGSLSNPATVYDREYTGTREAVVQIAPTLSTVGANGVVTGDNVSVTEGIAEFAQSDVGENIAVTGTSWGIAGGDSGNYIAPDQPIFAPASITRLPISASGIEITWPSPPPVFTGLPLTPIPEIMFGQRSLTHGTDFTLGGWQNNVNAGDNTASVTITGRGMFTGTVVSTFTIARATFTPAEYVKYVRYTDMGLQTVDIAAHISGRALPGDLPLTFTPVAVTGTPGIIASNEGTANGITFTIANNASANETATIPVTVGPFTNYQNMTVNVIVRTTDRTPVTVTIPDPSKPFDGAAVSVTPSAPGVPLDDFVITWLDETGAPLAPNEPPRNAGNWQVRAVVSRDSAVTYVGEHTRNFTISQRQVTVTASSHTITQGAALPTPTVTYTGFVTGDTAADALTTHAEARLNVADSNTVDTSVIDFAIHAELNDTIGTIGANYYLEHIYGTLTIRASSPGPDPDPGNGSGSGNGNGNGSPGPGPGPTPQRTSFRVTILNSPSGISVPIGQSDSVRTFEAGMSVPLVAGTREGFAFSGWTSNSRGVVFNNSNSANTSFTMPSNDVIITAIWTASDTPPDPTPPRPGSFSVIIENTPSDGAVPFGQSLSGRTFEEGTIVSLAAGTRDGFSFNNWYSNSSDIVFNNADNAYTIFTIPSNDAVFDSADNAYTSLTIPPNDIVFNSSNSVYISFIMPSNDVVLTANWIPAQFQVTIFNSPNGGAVPIGQSDSVRMFEAGAHVPLVAGTMEGFWFVNWGSISAGVVIDDASSASTGFTMPSNNVMIVANWAEGEEPPQPDPTPPPPDPTPPPPDPTPSPPSPTPAPPPGPGGESGNGHGSDDQDLVPKPGDGEDGDADVTQRGGFLPWLRVNLWWLSLILGAAILTVFWWFIIGRKRRKKEAIALPAEVTDLTAQQ